MEFALIWVLNIWGFGFVYCFFLGFFLLILVICSIFTGYSKSCGLPPECNIHCYVLDVSMPKRTMHCSPDLVTVLPRWFIYSLSSSCCQTVGPQTFSGSVPLMTCQHAHTRLRIRLWLVSVHGFLEDNLYEPNSSENKKKTAVNCFNAPFNAILCHFSVCCYDVLLLHFHEYAQCDLFQL